MLRAGVGGVFLRTLQSIYSEVQYVLDLNSGLCNSPGLSEKFSSTVGVKQGCVLSPLLFNLFISDLPDIFGPNCDPVELHNTTISCLLFADDWQLFQNRKLDSKLPLTTYLYTVKNGTLQLICLKLKLSYLIFLAKL